MANTTQTITSRFRTEGAEKVTKATEQIGRAQTRLGQASASAGRQFSAQANGLGGLVAAYAGAAATVFALQAAFQALNAAARAEQTITGVNALASAVGEAGPKIIKQFQEITKAQLSTVEAAELINLQLSSGFQADQIVELGEVALKASRALGRNLTDSVQRLGRGITKLEPELLDELGIFTRLDPAVEAYAKKLGRSTSSLSQFERRQAFANAVLTEGNEKFRDIDTSAATSAESLEQLASRLQNLGQNLGQLIAKGLQPLVDTLGDSEASVFAFGILARTVFGTALREISGSLQNAETRIDSFSDSLIDKVGGGTRRVKAATAGLAKGLSEVNLRTTIATAANRENFKSLIALGRAQELSFGQTKELNRLARQEAAANAQKINNLKSLATRTKAQTTELDRLTARETSFNNIAKETQKRIDSTGKASKLAAGGFRVLGTGATFAARGILSVLGALSTIVTVVAVVGTVATILLDFFGILDDVRAAIDRAFNALLRFFNLTKEFRAQGAGAEGLVQSVIGDQDLGFTGTRVVEDPLSDFTSRVRTKISSGAVQDAIQEALVSGATQSSDAFAQAIANNLDVQLSPEITKIAEKFFNELAGANAGTALGLSLFAEATGRTLPTVRKQLEVLSNGALRFQNIASAPGPLKTLEAQFHTAEDLKNATEERRKEMEKENEALVNRLQSQDVSANLQEALNSGAANAQQIEQRRAAVLTKINNLKKSGLAIDQETAAAQEATFKLQDQSAQAQLVILRERERILKTFSAQIKAGEKIAEFFSFEVENGKTVVKVAETQNDRTRNRNKLLLESFNIGKEALRLQRAGAALTPLQTQQAQLARDAQKALVGLFTRSVEEARKLAEQLDKVVTKQRQAADAARDQLAIVNAERALAITRRQVDLQNKELDRLEKIRSAEERLNQVRIQGSEAQRKAGQDLEKALAEQGFQTDESRRALELKFAKEDLDALKAITQGQIADIEAKAAIQEEKLKNEIAGLNKELGQGPLQQGGIAAVFAAREQAETKALMAQRDMQLKEVDLLEQRNKGIIAEAEAFTDHITGIAEVLAADITERQKLREGENFLNRTVDELFAAGRGGEAMALRTSGDVNEASRLRTDLNVGGAAKSAAESLSSVLDKLSKTDYSAARQAIQDAFQAEKELADTRRDIAQNDEIDKAEQKLKDARTALEELGILTEAELTAVNNALSQATTEYANLANITAGANDRMKAALKESQVIIEGGLISGFQEFNTALIEGNLTFKGVTQGFKDMLGNMLKEIQSAVFTKTIAEPIAGSIAKFLPKLFNSGGLVHLAGGGAMKRDRIPAMLEPGEYVIRKEAAKKLGMSKLAAMNSGITPDPLALLIARFNGSKVRTAIGGGGGAMGGFGPSDPGGGGPAGSGGMSGSGDHSGTSADGFGGFGGDADSRATFRAAQAAISAGMNPFASSTQMAVVAMANPTNQAIQDEAERFGKVTEGLGKKGEKSLASKAMTTLGKSLGLSVLGVTGAPAFAASFALDALGITDGLGLDDVGDLFKASGGRIRGMAGGGLVRDRVPAMLEPGEFVIRKPMAKAIGGAVLNQMNSTGKPPEVSVNVNNTGAPKDVAVKAPKMNGNKVIIDLITKDLKNNGAIKKSLRKK